MQKPIYNIIIMWLGSISAILCNPVTSPHPQSTLLEQLTSVNLELNTLHRRTLELFRQEKYRSTHLLNSATNFTLDSFTVYQDRVKRYSSKMTETIQYNDQFKQSYDPKCSSSLQMQRAIMTAKVKYAEKVCVKRALTEMCESTKSRFYAFRDEVLRQSFRAQWLTIAMMADFNVLTEPAMIVESLREVIDFSELMWDGTQANAREEVHRIGQDLVEIVSDVQQCGSEAFSLFERSMQQNMCLALWC